MFYSSRSIHTQKKKREEQNTHEKKGNILKWKQKGKENKNNNKTANDNNQRIKWMINDFHLLKMS